MKTLKLLFTIILTGTLLSSCVVSEVEVVEANRAEAPLSLNQLLSSYDLWYVDIQNTKGTAKVPFLQRAFTISFINGRMYGNNNIVGVGKTGNGFGVEIGSYNTQNTVVETFHRQGRSNFRVVQLSNDKIRLDDVNQNVSYHLIGYQKNNFDYDKLFYDNIEYFLQEFVAWEKVKQTGGKANPFDTENYLEFTPKNNNTFRSSKDKFGINVANINWNYIGGYKVADYNNVNNIKHLTLFYNNNDTERFDLFVINDETIKLKHLKSGTEYSFAGRGFIKYLRGGTGTTQKVNRNSGRERVKVTREKLEKKN